MEIANRLQQFIKKTGLSATSFAEEIGVQRSSISHIISGRNKPSLEFIEKVFIRFPEVDIQWLITGKKNVDPEPKNRSSSTQQKFEKLDHIQEVKKIKKVEKVMIFYSDQTFTSYNPNEK